MSSVINTCQGCGRTFPSVGSLRSHQSQRYVKLACRQAAAGQPTGRNSYLDISAMSMENEEEWFEDDE